MMVKYDLDIISESTRWQCHSFLSITPWNINFLLKYLNVIVIFITPVLKNLGKYLRQLLHFQDWQWKMIFLRQGRNCCVKMRIRLPGRHLSCSWVFSAGVPMEASEGCWIQTWSYPAQISEHHTLKSASPQNLLSFTVEKVKQKINGNFSLFQV